MSPCKSAAVGGRLTGRDIPSTRVLADTGRGIAEANSAPKNGIFLRGICSSRRTRRRCGIKSGNLRVSRHLSGGLTRSCSVQFLSAAAGREKTGEGACGPLPLAPYPKGTTPQSAAADSSPYTGEPKNNPSGAARQLPLRGAFESVRPASGGRWERGCRGSDSSPAGNAPRRGKMMCGFCAVAVSPQSAAAANGEETGGRCGVRRVSEAAEA